MVRGSLWGFAELGFEVPLLAFAVRGLRFAATRRGQDFATMNGKGAENYRDGMGGGVVRGRSQKGFAEIRRGGRGSQKFVAEVWGAQKFGCMLACLGTPLVLPLIFKAGPAYSFAA